MKKAIQVTIPMTPNYIAVGNEQVPIQEFSETELKEIGQEWTILLIEKSKRKRVTPKDQ